MKNITGVGFVEDEWSKKNSNTFARRHLSCCCWLLGYVGTDDELAEILVSAV